MIQPKFYQNLQVKKITSVNNSYVQWLNINKIKQNLQQISEY